MTRKRLKKLLMSNGIQRDLAEEITWQANESGIPYSIWWAINARKFCKTDLEKITANIQFSVETFCEHLQKISEALEEMAESCFRNIAQQFVIT